MKAYGQAILVSAIKYLDKTQFHDDEPGAIILMLDLLPDETRNYLISARLDAWQSYTKELLGDLA